MARQNKVIHVLQGKIGQYRALLKTHGIPDTVAPDDSFLAADMAALVASESAVDERDTDPDSGDAGGEDGAIVPVTKAMGSLAVSGAGAAAGGGGRDPKCVPQLLALLCPCNCSLQLAAPAAHAFLCGLITCRVSSFACGSPTPIVLGAGAGDTTLRLLELEDEIKDLRKKLEDREEELKSRQDEVCCANRVSGGGGPVLTSSASTRAAACCWAQLTHACLV